jgi:hypothetical protein
MVDALRQAFDALQAEYDKLALAYAQLQAQGNGLNGYAKFPIMGLDANPAEKIVTSTYRKLAKIFHADVGGSDEQMLRLNKERDAALREAVQPGGTGVSAS